MPEEGIVFPVPGFSGSRREARLLQRPAPAAGVAALVPRSGSESICFSAGLPSTGGLSGTRAGGFPGHPLGWFCSRAPLLRPLPVNSSSWRLDGRFPASARGWTSSKFCGCSSAATGRDGCALSDNVCGSSWREGRISSLSALSQRWGNGCSFYPLLLCSLRFSFLLASHSLITPVLWYS